MVEVMHVYENCCSGGRYANGHLGLFSYMLYTVVCFWMLLIFIFVCFVVVGFFFCIGMKCVLEDTTQDDDKTTAKIKVNCGSFCFLSKFQCLILPLFATTLFGPVQDKPKPSIKAKCQDAKVTLYKLVAKHGN